MAINYTETPNGLFVDLDGRLGSIQATISRPTTRKEWRLCFATCIGEAHSLQGKVRDFPKLESVKHELNRYDGVLNAPLGEPMHGFRGMPPKELSHV
jgi:hypothetical protein